MSSQLSLQQIQASIIRLPNHPPAMLASDLAVIYETEPRQIVQAVSRNPDRFPEPEFCFRLTDEEWANLRSQNVTSSQKGIVFPGPLGEILKSQNVISSHGGARKVPLALTRMGANMLSAVLKTPVAAARSVQIMRAFSALEEAAAVPTPQPTPRPAPETVTLTKDEYIDLLKAQIALHEAQPRRRVLEDAEKAEILTLRDQGWTPAAISRQVGRPVGSIETFLRRVRLGLEE